MHEFSVRSVGQKRAVSEELVKNIRLLDVVDIFWSADKVCGRKSFFRK
jgi:hypothetical protein